MGGFDKREKGIAINNLPEPDKGVLTGYFEIDLYGCWWEVLRANNTKFWMIGDSPDYLKDVMR